MDHEPDTDSTWRNKLLVLFRDVEISPFFSLTDGGSEQTLVLEKVVIIQD